MSRLGRDYRWRQVRTRVLRDAEVCAICGGLLDFDAPPRSPLAPSVDHVLPISQIRALYDPIEARRVAVDPSLLRAAHYGCNSRRGAARRPAKATTEASREW
jgi:5-methylcytosine-specific restriction endonuclease McrA